MSIKIEIKMESIIVGIFLMLMIVVNGEAVTDQTQNQNQNQTQTQTQNVVSNSTEVNELLKKDLEAIVVSLEESIGKTGELKSLTSDQMMIQAIDICCKVQQESINSVRRAVDRVGNPDPAATDEYMEDLKIWVGGVFSDQTMCLGGFDDTPPTDPVKEKVTVILENPRKLTMSAFEVMEKMGNGPPPSSSPGRGLLRRLTAAAPPNVVVAKDGTGKYATINEALAEIPPNNAAPFVIHVKEGVYEEKVIFEKGMNNVVLFGDGPLKSRVTGKLSVAGGLQTANTATVAVKSDNFLCRDMGFENTAGVEGKQAVALLVQGDKAVFLNCAMDGFQDTLNAEKYRQFYRDCTITGTIDFVFGDAAAVFQNCKMLVRQPGFGIDVVVVAHGKEAEPNPTGFVLQNCNIGPAPGLTGAGTEYTATLGRPWGPFAKTVIIQSEIDGMFDPAGWSEWKGKTNHETCYFAEFENRGPGAALDKRPTWKGYVKITKEIAQEYVASKFLVGDDWIPQTGVPYEPGWMAV